VRLAHGARSQRSRASHLREAGIPAIRSAAWRCQALRHIRRSARGRGIPNAAFPL